MILSLDFCNTNVSYQEFYELQSEQVYMLHVSVWALNQWNFLSLMNEMDILSRK